MSSLDVMLCVVFAEPDGPRHDYMAAKSMSALPRVGDRISIAPRPWNVLVVQDVTHQLNGEPPMLTCVPFSALDSNQKLQDMVDMLRQSGFEEITVNTNKVAAEWRERGDRRGER